MRCLPPQFYDWGNSLLAPNFENYTPGPSKGWSRISQGSKRINIITPFFDRILNNMIKQDHHHNSYVWSRSVLHNLFFCLSNSWGCNLHVPWLRVWYIFPPLLGLPFTGCTCKRGPWSIFSDFPLQRWNYRTSLAFCKSRDLVCTFVNKCIHIGKHVRKLIFICPEQR